MNPIAIDGPVVEPVSLADMKAYLRIDGDDEDELVAALIMAARITIERAARIALIAQTWRLRLSAWPRDRVVPLPLRPVMSVEAVRVATGTAPPAAVDTDLYRLDETGQPARLLVEADVPDPTPRTGGIEIDLVVGFGAGPASVPEPLILATRRLVAFWFEARGDEPGRAASGLPADVASLLAPFTDPRLA